MLPSCADGEELRVRLDGTSLIGIAAARIGSIIARPAPAYHRIVYFDTAGVISSGAESNKLRVCLDTFGVSRHGSLISVKAPACGCVVRLDAATVLISGAYGQKLCVCVNVMLTGRWIGSVTFVAKASISPACGCVVYFDAATVVAPGADSQELHIGSISLRACGRIGLAMGWAAPALNRTICFNTAGVEVSSTDLSAGTTESI